MSVSVLDPETDIMDQFLDPETDIMGERTFIGRLAGSEPGQIDTRYSTVC